MRRRGAIVTLAAAAALATGCGADDGDGRPVGGAEPSPAATASPAPGPAALPAPGGRLPSSPAGIAAELTDVSAWLLEATRRWRAEGDLRRPVPRDVELLALRQQRLELRLADRPGLIRRTLARLPADLAADVRDGVLAQRRLRALSRGWPVTNRRHRTGPPEAPARLRRLYRVAQRRFGVRTHTLAAVHLVESAFGRMRNESVSGAQGPMQFMPATWAAYGMGGDVHDTRDAIMGAANYLRANGAPRRVRRALHRYNPSSLYVDAVSRYARRIRGDVDAFLALYARQVFVRTPDGRRRITGPGR